MSDIRTGGGGGGILRVHIGASALFAQVGINNTIKAVKVSDQNTIGEAQALLLPRLTRGTIPEVKIKIESECEGYAFYARHTTLNSVSKIDPNDLAADWLPTGIKGASFSVEFLPESGLRVNDVRRKSGSIRFDNRKKGESISPKKKRQGPSSGGTRSKSSIHPAPAPALESISLFGAHLLHISSKSGDEWKIPPIIDTTINHIQEYGLSQVGVFRISASASELDKYKQDCDDGVPLSFTADADSVTLASALLKVFLRELMEPLCTWGFYSPALYIQRLVISDSEKLEYLRSLHRMLPQPNWTIYKKLLGLLALVQEKSEENKMTGQNLAVVVGPSICKPLKSDALTEMADMSDLNSLFALIFENSSFILEEEEEEEEEKYVACVSGKQNGEGDMLELNGEEFIFVQKITEERYLGLNLQNGETGSLLKSNITETYLDITVLPVAPPVIRKEKDKDAEERRRKEAKRQAKSKKEEEKKAQKRKEEEEKEGKKAAKAKMKELQRAQEELMKGGDVTRDQLLEQLKLVSSLNQDLQRQHRIIFRLSQELGKAVSEIDDLKREVNNLKNLPPPSPYVDETPQPTPALGSEDSQIMDTLRESVKTGTREKFPFPMVAVLQYITENVHEEEAPSPPKTLLNSILPPTRTSSPPKTLLESILPPPKQASPPKTLLDPILPRERSLSRDMSQHSSQPPHSARGSISLKASPPGASDSSFSPPPLPVALPRAALPPPPISPIKPQLPQLPHLPQQQQTSPRPPTSPQKRTISPRVTRPKGTYTAVSPIRGHLPPPTRVGPPSSQQGGFNPPPGGQLPMGAPPGGVALPALSPTKPLRPGNAARTLPRTVSQTERPRILHSASLKDGPRSPRDDPKNVFSTKDC